MTQQEHSEEMSFLPSKTGICGDRYTGKQCGFHRWFPLARFLRTAKCYIRFHTQKKSARQTSIKTQRAGNNKEADFIK